MYKQTLTVLTVKQHFTVYTVTGGSYNLRCSPQKIILHLTLNLSV